MLNYVPIFAALALIVVWALHRIAAHPVRLAGANGPTTPKQIHGRSITHHMAIKESEEFFADGEARIGPLPPEYAESLISIATQAEIGLYLLQDSRIIYANPFLMKLLGYSESELRNLESPFVLVHPEDRQRVEQAVRERLEGLREHPRLDCRLLSRIGDELVVEVFGTLTTFRGRPAAMGAVVDVTARYRAEKALEENEQRYRGLIESQQNLIVRVDADYNFVFVNEAYCHTFGRTCEELIGKPFMPLVNEEDLPGTLEAMKKLYVPPYRIAVKQRAMTATGWRWLEWEDCSILDESGRVVEIQAVGRDITEAHFIEEELRKSEQKFRVVAERSPAAIFIFQGEQMVYVNPASEQITGYTSDEILKLKFFEVIHPDARERIREQGMMRLKGGNVPGGIEVPILTKQGETKWMLYSGDLIELKDEPAVLGIALDITHQREVQEQLRKAEELRYEQARTIAGGMAHEVHNSLYPARLMLDKLRETIESERGSDSDSVQRLLGMIERSIERAGAMIESVAQFSRLSSVAERQSIVLRELVATVIEDRPRDFVDAVRITRDIPIDLTVLMNWHHAYSLFKNVITNALDAVEMADSPQIHIEARQKTDTVAIRIVDNGHGLSPEAQQKAFAAFYTTKPRIGSGLGLAICRRIVDLYGGTICFDDKVDIGVAVDIFLPNATADRVEE